MIQSPQVQYIPAQQPMTTAQVPATTPIQYTQQTPGVIYNYPTASTYMPAQPYTGQKSQYNGVNIEIINPQGQAGMPQNACQMPAQFMPVQQPVMIPQYPVQYPASQAIVQAPQYDYAAVTPQASVPAPVVTPAAAPVVENSTPVNPAVSPETFAGKLAVSDLDSQKSAIEELANTIKNGQDEANLLLDTQIFDALTAIIDKDTSALECPSPEVIELRQKPEDQLSEADKEKASTPSPLEKAEINKQYALYTIAYMQERLNNELVKRNNQALELKDLPAIEKVIDTVKSNPNPTLRVAGIAALSYIAKPEYKSDLTTIFELAKADEDDRVKEAATKAAQDINA